MKHTAGPWFYIVDGHGDNKEGEIDTMDSPLNEPIAIIPHDDCNTKQYRMSKANARLISSAPDLLEACKMVSRSPYSQDAIDFVRAAIRKAEGGNA